MVETIGNQNIQTLKQNFSLLPFNRAVSKYNIEEDIDLDIVTTSRKVIDFKLNRLIKNTNIDQTTRFQPIIGGAGCGKTHYYWVLKARERSNQFDAPYRVIYVSSPPTPYRLMHHIYTCLADEIADEYFFLSMADAIFEELNISVEDIENINPKILIAKVLPTFPGIFSDCVKALIYLRTYGSHTIRGALALRWLLGESLTEEELKELQINSVLEQDDICLAMIKIISDLTRVVLIFYFDEMESPYRTFGPEAQQKFFEYIKRLYNELRNSIIITSCLHEIWDEILKTADGPTTSRMEPELVLDNFKEGDLKVYYLRAMSRFWASTDIPPPKDVYYPLTNEIFDEIYDVSKGNQRECIKNIAYKMESELFGYEYKPYNSSSLSRYEEFTKNLQLTTSQRMSVDPNLIATQLESKISALAKFGEDNHNDSNLIEESEDIEEEREPTPGNVLQVILKQIKLIYNNNGIDFNLSLDHSYEINDKSKKLGALIKCKKGTQEQMIGIEIPSIKSFTRSAGVAAYYALKRLDDAIDDKIIDKGIVIIPSATKGNKYSSLLTKNGNTSEIKVDCDIVNELVNHNKEEISKLRNYIEEVLKF